MFQYCLFDLDGTLTDPGEGITRCVQYALRSLGIEEPDPFVRKILERFEIKKYFDVIVGSEIDGARSTKEEVVKEALCRLAAFGLNEGELEAAGADYIADTVEELEDFLMGTGYGAGNPGRSCGPCRDGGCVSGAEKRTGCRKERLRRRKGSGSS